MGSRIRSRRSRFASSSSIMRIRASFSFSDREAMSLEISGNGW